MSWIDWVFAFPTKKRHHYKKDSEESGHEVCKDKNDVAHAKTTRRIISITAKKSWELLNIKNPSLNIVSIFQRFVSHRPITKQEQWYFLDFINNPSTKQIAQHYFSGLHLLQGDQNAEFVDSFLKNSDGKLDITQFINYLKTQLESYPLIIDIDGTIDFIATPTKHASLANEQWEIEYDLLFQDFEYFSYTHKEKFWILLLKGWEMFHVYGFLEIPKIINDNTFFWVKENYMRWHLEPLWKSTLIAPYAYDKRLWALFHFNGSDFEEVYKKPGVIDIHVLNDNYFMLDGEHSKKWLIKITNTANELLPMLYEKINVIQWFILTSQNKNEKWEYKLQVMNEQNWVIHELLEETSLDDTFHFSWYEENPNQIWNFDIIDPNYIEIQTSTGINIYRFIPDENILHPISWLSWIKSISKIKDFFEWKPTEIVFENKNRWIYSFNKETWILTHLIQYQNNEMHFDPLKITTERLEINYLKWPVYFYWKDWVLYTIKKWYKYCDYRGHCDYIKKWFFWEKIRLWTSYEEVSEYVIPVTWTIVL